MSLLLDIKVLEYDSKSLCFSQKRAKPRRCFLLFPSAWQPSDSCWWAVIFCLTLPRVAPDVLTGYHFGFRVAEICSVGKGAQNYLFCLTNVSVSLLLTWVGYLISRLAWSLEVNS